MVTMHFRYARYLIGGLLLLLATLTQAELTASIDRNEVQQGETVTLTVTALLEDTPFSLFDLNTLKVPQPDTSVLEQDFEILGQDQRYSMQFTNNVSETRIFWEYTLVPKRTGEIRIPPLSWQKEKTPSLTLTVREAPAATTSDAPVRIEAELDDDEAYVGEQRILNMRLLYREDMARGQWPHPDHPDLVIRQLGKQSEFTRLINGKAYHGLARRYALFPRKAGKLTIRPVTFEGLLIHDIRKTLTKRTASSPELTLTVKPVPESAPAPWLPARRLSMTETWTPDTSDLKVGDSLTREITLEALGLDAADLPEIVVPTLPEGIRIYPQPAQRDTRETAYGLTGRLRVAWAIVPTRPGTYTLPAIEIRYWNTVADKAGQVTLPPRTLNVTGDQLALPAATSGNTDTGGDDPAQWFWKVLAGFLALGWAFTAGLVWYRHRRKAASAGTPHILTRQSLPPPPKVERDVPGFLREAELWLESVMPMARRHGENEDLVRRIRQALNDLAGRCYGHPAEKRPDITATRALQHDMQALYKALLDTANHEGGFSDWVTETSKTKP